jgi:hypothetical protein
MAASAVAVMTNPELQRRITHVALRRVREQFCAERVVPMYERHYEHVLR